MESHEQTPADAEPPSAWAARIDEIVAAAEQTAADVRAEAEQRADERITEAQRAADHRVNAAEE